MPVFVLPSSYFLSLYVSLFPFCLFIALHHCLNSILRQTLLVFLSDLIGWAFSFDPNFFFFSPSVLYCILRT